jgi:hypothetical protein
MLLLIISCLSAEPTPAQIPDNVRTYFERCDNYRATRLHPHHENLADLQAKLRFETERVRIGKLKAQIRDSEAALATLQKTPLVYHIEFNFLPATKPDTIGHLTPATITAVIDPTTALVTVKRDGTRLILTGIDTKDLKPRQTFASPEPWQRVPNLIQDDQVKRMIGPVPHFTVKPVKPADIEKYRPQYEAEKQKAEAAKKAAPAQ